MAEDICACLKRIALFSMLAFGTLWSARMAMGEWRDKLESMNDAQGQETHVAMIPALAIRTSSLSSFLIHQLDIHASMESPRHDGTVTIDCENIHTTRTRPPP